MSFDGGGDARDEVRSALDLVDWRRRVAELYAEVRSTAIADPEAAWERWRAEREALYRSHPSSPVPIAGRASFTAHHWPYDPRWRCSARLVAPPDAAAVRVGNADAPSQALPGLAGLSLAMIAVPASVGAPPPMDLIGSVTVALPGGERTLPVFRLAEYSTGLFLPFGDATNGTETYRAGRYLLDTAKSADLGGDPAAATLVLDFNFAYHPSCAFDPRWSCPLAPGVSRLDLPVEAGERLT